MLIEPDLQHQLKVDNFFDHYIREKSGAYSFNLVRKIRDYLSLSTDEDINRQEHIKIQQIKYLMEYSPEIINLLKDQKYPQKYLPFLRKD